jgi:hypothetical protein
MVTKYCDKDSDQNLLNLIQAYLVARAVGEFRRPGRLGANDRQALMTVADPLPKSRSLW